MIEIQVTNLSKLENGDKCACCFSCTSHITKLCACLVHGTAYCTPLLGRSKLIEGLKVVIISHMIYLPDAKEAFMWNV